VGRFESGRSEVGRKSPHSHFERGSGRGMRLSHVSSEGGGGGSNSKVVVARNDPPSRVSSEGKVVVGVGGRKFPPPLETRVGGFFERGRWSWWAHIPSVTRIVSGRSGGRGTLLLAFRARVGGGCAAMPLCLAF
jgi:hypothetical protein